MDAELKEGDWVDVPENAKLLLGGTRARIKTICGNYVMLEVSGIPGSRKTKDTAVMLRGLKKVGG